MFVHISTANIGRMLKPPAHTISSVCRPIYIGPWPPLCSDFLL